MALTQYEGLALLALIGMLLVGSGAQVVRDQLVPLPPPTLPADHHVFTKGVAALDHGAAQPDASPSPVAETPSSPAASAPSSARKKAVEVPAGPVNVNTATVHELDQLPGVGPAIAKRIIDYRTTHGAFKSVAALQRVRGIGPKTVAKFEGHAVVE